MVGKGLLLITSVLDRAGLLCLLLCPQSHPLRPELTLYFKKPNLLFQKKLLSNKILIILNSQLRLLRSLSTSKIVLLTVQTLLCAECNLYLNYKQKNKNRKTFVPF